MLGACKTVPLLDDNEDAQPEATPDLHAADPRSIRNAGRGDVPFLKGAPCDEDELAAGPIGGFPHAVKDEADGL